MNLPNKITLTRIFMIPIFVAIFFLDGIIPFAFGIAAIVFALAACTDFIDGHIARSRGLVTNLGKFLDPIADKALTTTMFILFAIDGIIPPLVVLIMVWRDILVDGIGIGNVVDSVIEERIKMANDGVIILGAVVSSKEKRII